MSEQDELERYNEELRQQEHCEDNSNVSDEQLVLKQLALYETPHSSRPLSRLLQQAIEIQRGVSTGPWIADTKEAAGKNWLLGCVIDCGLSSNDSSYIVTTHNVRASELEGDPESDALFIAFARNAWPEIIEHLHRLNDLER